MLTTFQRAFALWRLLSGREVLAFEVRAAESVLLVSIEGSTVTLTVSPRRNHA